MTYRVNQFYVDAYNTSTGFEGDEATLFESWSTKSTSTRNTLNHTAAIPYGDAHRETIDLFFAENSKKWLVFIHGGYWRVMTSAHFHYLATPFIEAGWNVAFPEYDLCPAVTIHTIVDQCRRAIAWLANNHHCQEIVISGHSAGGHLTGMMWTTDWASFGMDASLISGGIAISSLFDLDPIAQTTMNSVLKLTVEDVQELSPARLLPQITAPLVLTVGAKESSEFQRQNTIIRGIPEWETITSEPLSLVGYHHYNILDLLMDLDSEMWQALRDMQR